MLIGLEEVTTRAQAELLLEYGVFIEEARSAAREDADGWALEEILGCWVVEEESGRVLGTVVDIWLLPANDVWVIETETSYLPLPVVSEVVRRVDPKERRIEVRLLPGLLEIAEPKRADDREFAEEGVDAD
jgi:ribosomal 30S subunit maturation factor RimM